MKNNIIKFFGAVIVSSAVATSCADFLTEHPKTFLSPDSYYTKESQMDAAVNGLYIGLSNYFTGGVGVGVSPYHMLELITGNVDRTQPGSDEDLAIKIPLKETNTYVASMWRELYASINNCNSVITGLENASEDIDIAAAKKDDLIGQAHFLRAYYYFQLVRLWGPVPLFTEQTADLKDTKVVPSSEADVYAVIVEDLKLAESKISDWIKTDGHVSKGAAAGLLAKVYLTMSGYPLRQDHYADAYAEAKKVIDSHAYSLFGSYADLRSEGSENRGEWVFSLQREANNAGSGMHTSCLPYPIPNETPIAENNIFGGCVIPLTSFVNSYANGDLRTEDGKGFYYSSYPALDGSGKVEFSKPYIYKFFDANAVSSGKSGLDYPLLRYADILLIAAEAACKGGSTSDAAAIDAYYQVRHRAMPAEIKPNSISFEDVYKERMWELCFETQTWYDMIRTRKAFKCDSGDVVDLIGYQAPKHDVAFKETDMYLPYPEHDRLLNENLTR